MVQSRKRSCFIQAGSDYIDKYTKKNSTHSPILPYRFWFSWFPSNRILHRWVFFSNLNFVFYFDSLCAFLNRYIITMYIIYLYLILLQRNIIMDWKLSDVTQTQCVYIFQISTHDDDFSLVNSLKMLGNSDAHWVWING